MRPRQGNNPKRRIGSQATLEQQEKIQRKAIYVGSGHHKLYPANYKFRVTNPRPTKSLCDLNRVILLREATALMISGVERLMFSELNEEGMPKYIWAVSDAGEVFECKTDPSTPWQYHGYPINNEESFSAYILKEWNDRHV